MRRWIQVLAVMLVITIVSAMSQVNVYAAEATPAADAKSEEEKTEEEKAKEAEEQKQKELEALYNIPVESNELKNWIKGPGTYGESAIVMDVGSGAILYAKGIDRAEYPASITKVLTALLAYKYGDMSGNVTITAHALECLGSGYASIGMKEGNVISMDQAMHAMLMASSNEVACAIGEAVAANQGQDYNWFIQQMNETVKELGGTDSNFVNTNGVHSEDHYTCARDMALIGRALFQYPEFFNICQTQEYTIPASPTTEEHIFQQKHDMLTATDSDYDTRVIGGKTGYTTEANNTLITMADNGERQLVCVALKTYAGHVYTDTKALLDYGFGNDFQKVSIVENLDSEDAAKINYIPEDAYVLLPEHVKFKSLDPEITWRDKEAGEATLTYYYKDMPVGSADVTVDKMAMNNKEIEFSDTSDSGNDADESGISSLEPKQIAIAAGIGVVLILAAILLIRQHIKRRRMRTRRRKQAQQQVPRNRDHEKQQ